MSFRKIFYRGALITILLSAGMLRACHYKIEYLNFEVADATVAEADLRDPNNWTYSGDKIAYKSVIDWDGKSVQILQNSYGPELTVHSPIPLSNVIVTGTRSDQDGSAEVFQQSLQEEHPYGSTCVNILDSVDNEFIIALHYQKPSTGGGSCIRIGDEVSIDLVPEDGERQLTVNVVLVRSGHAWHCDCL